jgi:hypothetical protein
MSKISESSRWNVSLTVERLVVNVQNDVWFNHGYIRPPYMLVDDSYSAFFGFDGIVYGQTVVSIHNIVMSLK